MCAKLIIINGNLSDYVSSSEDKESTLTVALTPPPHSPTFDALIHDHLEDHPGGAYNHLKRPNVPQSSQPATAARQPPTMARIQRDLNSPSASLRLRAIRALKSPTKSSYAQFDVPHDEESIIKPDERIAPPATPTIQELMRNVIVYVEVRTGEDNRSTGVKKVISALGARVNDKLLRDTTHVIFKDGLLSTYKKARSWNIPVVSILWIEACKNQRRICNPREYPISNFDRYENPELYERLKRHKSMQPDSECNKRVRAKPGNGTPKDSTPQTASGTLKKTSTLIGGTPSSASNKKTDISHYFKALEGNKNIRKVGGVSSTPAMAVESPATQLLNRIHSNSFISSTAKETPVPAVEQNTDNPVTIPCNAKRTLNFVENDAQATATPRKCVTQRRRSHSVQAIIDATTVSIEEMSLSQTPQRTSRMTRRRYSMQLAANLTPSTTAADAGSVAPLHEPRTNCAIIAEEEPPTAVTVCSPTASSSRKHTKPKTLSPKKRVKRRTTYTSRPVDISECAAEKAVYKDKPTQRRRTLYTPQHMDESLVQSVALSTAETLDKTKQRSKVQPKQRRRTLYTPANMEVTVPSEVSPESSLDSDPTLTNVPQRDALVEQKMHESVTLVDIPTSATFHVCTNEITAFGHSSGSQLGTAAFTPISAKPTGSAQPPVDAAAFESTPLQKDSLLEEHKATLVFSSTRKPGHRRTLFDISMDIISQRLQNINKTARRSIAPHAVASDLCVRRGSLDEQQATMLNSSQSAHGLLCNEPTTTLSGEPTENKLVEEDTTSLAKKKRKLFLPNHDALTLTPQRSQPSSNTSLATPSKSAKRRKTLLSLSQPHTDKKTTSAVANKPVVRPSRRSTMDFVDSDIGKPTTAIKTTIPSHIKQRSGSTSGGSVSSGKTQSAKSNALAPLKTNKKLPFLVYTNMHKEQIDVIRETIKKLGNFELENCVSDNTTHLVSLEPRRTLNMLRALVRGLWILEYSWITDSQKAGRWLHEEQYELRDFSRAVEICRAERQAFGSIYKCELFTSLGPFYISSRCGHIPKQDLTELIHLCGGSVVAQRKRAKYILGNANRLMEDKVYITPYWILDSITQMQLLKFHRYTFPHAAPKPTQPYRTQPYQSQTQSQAQKKSPETQSDLEKSNF